MLVIITSLDHATITLENSTSATIPTKDGIISVLPGHVPLLSALGNGILSVTSESGTKKFAISGGALETDGQTLRILTDMAEDIAEDIETIRARKLEAEKLMQEAKESGDPISMERLIEIETEYQKDTAREQLAMGNHRN